MGNKIEIGDNNKISKTNIAGNNINKVDPQKNRLWKWFLKHLETILVAIISGATSAFVSWLITYLVLRLP